MTLGDCLVLCEVHCITAWGKAGRERLLFLGKPWDLGAQVPDFTWFSVTQETSSAIFLSLQKLLTQA